jgi:hypothetical protein
VIFHSHQCVETSAEVWAVIRARHGDELSVFSTFSDPGGTFNGGPGLHGCMETTYGLHGADYPLIGARTTWDIGEKDKRMNQRTEYFLFAIEKVEDQ